MQAYIDRFYSRESSLLLAEHVRMRGARRQSIEYLTLEKRTNQRTAKSRDIKANDKLTVCVLRSVIDGAIETKMNEWSHYIRRWEWVVQVKTLSMSCPSHTDHTVLTSITCERA